MTTDDALLAAVMRRCANDEDMLADLWPKSLMFDGHVRVSLEEHKALARAGFHDLDTRFNG